MLRKTAFPFYDSRLGFKSKKKMNLKSYEQLIYIYIYVYIIYIYIYIYKEL